MGLRHTTHDLYVANTGGFNVLVYHRGKTTPFNMYTDPTVQYPVDVTIAKDGTVFASNIYHPSGPEAGSISTWIGGPHGGTFVGNFPMTNDFQGGFITVQRRGTVYYNDIDVRGNGVLWSLTCPVGACGSQTQVAGVSFAFPGGMGSDATDDLLVLDQGLSTANTFELPNPTPSTCPVSGSPIAMALSKDDHHLFTTDVGNDAVEYSYPSCALVGTVPGSGGDGIAVDPGHAQ